MASGLGKGRGELSLIAADCERQATEVCMGSAPSTAVACEFDSSFNDSTIYDAAAAARISAGELLQAPTAYNDVPA